ncbi:General negative regulator of transcription subunit 4 [Candida viswanathii]|uniref:General negative regulator of transcription subunit 4 n=1 Tax=Candida viswanathii TaxID=5486 RepID=A0A367Y0R6_9ASCO|nr:General negative regulator of transcription subunit 4 [Candida viswanathii]
MFQADDTFISDDEEEYCPLCVEEMDISDKNFKPCPCGYQICQFCYNNIRQNPELNGRCPGCRRLYDDESVEYKTVSAEEYKLMQLKKEKREREKKQKEKEKKEMEMANKKHLAGLRVVQKNLVYVTGLNPPCNPDDLHSVLRSDKYFGQYGKISKIVINKKSPNPQTTAHHHQNPGLVVYVTFARKEDALKCITELDGSLCDGRVLRAAHGTTKYCSSYLRGHPCPNPNCMFLHEPGEEADSYTRKDLSTQQGIKMGMTSGSHTTSFGEESASHHHLGHHISDDELQPQSSLQQQAGHEIHKEHLPSTAHWATTGTTSGSNSPSVNNNIPLANSAAFPTLGEIARDMKQQQKKEVKPRIKSVKSNNFSVPDDVELDDNSVLKFVESTTEQLRGLDDVRNVRFKNFDNGKVLPLFNFKGEFTNDTKPEDEKLIARQVIERFLLRPIKNYHLAYQNHPITQQQAMLQRQQQVQQQQVQQHTPSLQVAQLQQQKNEEQQKQAQHQILLLQLQQQQQLQQLQQQQQQQQLQQQQQQSQLANQLNTLKLGDRVNTSTPPPPGLFAAKAGGAPTEVSSSVGAGLPSSSSQLLTQLMSGKK